ncbi:hypothetical protein D3C75_1104540 [compost metagenome]
MRRKPGGRAKCANQLVAPKPGLPGQYRQAQLRRVLAFDARNQPTQRGRPQGRCRCQRRVPGKVQVTQKGNQRRILLTTAGVGEQQTVQFAELPIHLRHLADTCRLAGPGTLQP